MRNVRPCLALAGLAIGLLVVPAAHAQQGGPPVLDSASCSASALLAVAPGRPACTTRVVSCEPCFFVRATGRVTASAGLGNAGATGRVVPTADAGVDQVARCGQSPGRCSATTGPGAPSEGESAAFRASCAWGSSGLSLFTGVSCSVEIRGLQAQP